jgi:peroxiredoxin
MRQACSALVALTTVLCLSARPGDPPASSRVGTKIADFRLPDTQGKPVAFADQKGKAVVVLFTGTQCPLANLYLARMAELHKEFSPQGVSFLAVYANLQDDARKLAEYVKKQDIPYPALRDETQQVADQFGARRTPEVFVLDATRTVRYQGRIDDQFGIDIRRTKATRNDLAEALREILNGKDVSVASTPVVGCLIGRGSKKADTGTVTYNGHVAAVLQKNCQDCHRPGQIGPMPLLTYEDASAWGEMIAEVVKDRRMPPWYADPKHGKFSNDRSLPAKDRELLLTWVEQGMPKGDPKLAPKPRQFVEGWSIGQPDAVVTMATEFDVPAEMPKFGVPYQYFVVDPKLDEDRWVVRAEAKAGAPEVVHHIIVFMVPPGVKFNPADPKTQVVAGMAPGEMPLMLPPGYARHLPKGSKFVFQMHYTPAGKAQKDRSSIGLVFAKEPPKHVVVTKPVFNQKFLIPPGASNYEVQSSYVLKEDGQVVGIMPHMHLRGKDFTVRAHYPDGKVETLLAVPRFSFSWQSVYRPEPALNVPKGTRIQCVAHFDNSKNNPNNPDPTRPVFWGDQTWEEMMIGWTDFAYERKE